MKNESLPKKGQADKPLNLDPDFFDPDNKLKQDIRDVLMDVLADVKQELAKKDFDLEDEGVILTGSLVDVNFDKNSDVDFHVLVDFNKFDDPTLVQNFLQSFAKNYNNRFNLRGRNLELYFQDSREPHISPGVYDVVNNDWIIPPEGVKIVRTPQMLLAADSIKKRIDRFVKEYEEADKSDKDIVVAHLAKLQGFFSSLRDMRKRALSAGGLGSFGNQVFKLLRRNGAFDSLTKLITRAKDDFFECSVSKSDKLLLLCALAEDITQPGGYVAGPTTSVRQAVGSISFSLLQKAKDNLDKRQKADKKRKAQLKGKELDGKTDIKFSPRGFRPDAT